MDGSSHWSDCENKHLMQCIIQYFFICLTKQTLITGIQLVTLIIYPYHILWYFPLTMGSYERNMIVSQGEPACYFSSLFNHLLFAICCYLSLYVEVWWDICKPLFYFTCTYTTDKCLNTPQNQLLTANPIINTGGLDVTWPEAQVGTEETPIQTRCRACQNQNRVVLLHPTKGDAIPEGQTNKQMNKRNPGLRSRMVLLHGDPY